MSKAPKDEFIEVGPADDQHAGTLMESVDDIREAFKGQLLEFQGLLEKSPYIALPETRNPDDVERMRKAITECGPAGAKCNQVP